MIPLQSGMELALAPFLCASIGLGLFVYFIPSIIALWRNHTSRVMVILLNILLGWTFVGWLIALIFALAGKSDPNKSIFFS